MLSILDLPTELLSKVFQDFEDVRDYIDIALTCKKFQKIIQGIVVTTGDGPDQSELFKSISNNYIQIDLDEENPHLKASLKGYKHFIFEYSLYKRVHLQSYIKCLSKAKPKRRYRITEVYLNEYSARYSFGLQNVNDIKLEDSYVYDVIRTIYAYGSDFALLIEHWYSSNSTNQDSYESISIVAHHYNFSTLKILPWLMVARNPHHVLALHGKLVELICGVINIDKTALPCSEAALDGFFQRCTLPNLTKFHGLSVGSGFTFKSLEKYDLLEELRITSYVSETPIPEDISVTLPNLNLLEIAGDSITLSNLNLPKLTKLALILQGSTRLGHQSDLVVKSLNVPSMESLDLRLMVNSKHSGHDVLKGFNNFNNLKHLKILANLQLSDLACFPFPNLESLEVRSIPFTIDYSHSGAPLAQTIDTKQIIKNQAPNLKSMRLLDILGFYDLLFADDRFVYTGLKELMITVDYKSKSDVKNRYSMSEANYPDLEELTLITRNFKIPKEGDFETLVNITIDLPRLKVISGLKAFLDRCITWKSDPSSVKVVKL